MLTVACLALSFAQTGRAQNDNDWRWMNEHYHDILKDILPNKVGMGWTVGVRSYREEYGYELEYSCAFGKNGPRGTQRENLDVLIRMADAERLYDQILRLHLRNRSMSIKRIEARLKIREWHLTEQSCPAIRSAYEDFYTLSLPTLTAEERREREENRINIIVHPVTYDIRAVISGGDLQISFWAADQDHPFLRWARKTRATLDRCIQEGKYVR